MDWTILLAIGAVCISAAAFAFGLIHVLLGGDWTVLLTMGGVCISGAAFAFGLIYVLPRARSTQPGSADAERYDGLRELCMAITTGGMVLGSISAIANNARFAVPPVNPAILLGAGALFVWLCGFWLGRVSLRLRHRATDITTSQ